MKNKKFIICVIVSILLLGIISVNVRSCFSRGIKDPKVITQINTKDCKYLEKEIFGFIFPEGVEIEKARLSYGRDGGVCVQFKNIKNYDDYISKEVRSKLTDINMYNEINVNIDGATVDVKKIVGYIDGRRRYISIYKDGDSYSIELFTEYIKEEVYDIFK